MSRLSCALQQEEVVEEEGKDREKDARLPLLIVLLLIFFLLLQLILLGKEELKEEDKDKDRERHVHSLKHCPKTSQARKTSLTRARAQRESQRGRERVQLVPGFCSTSESPISGCTLTASRTAPGAAQTT